MSSSSTYDRYTRTHPAYTAGYRAGFDVGLRVGLDAITAEIADQDDQAVIATATIDAAAAQPHQYAAGRLHAVAQVIGGKFRQVTP
jgi:hypothetical protein